MARFVVVPQWQGSPSSRAMAHVDGTEAIAGDLPRAACTAVEVPLEAGEPLGTGVLRASALLRTRDALATALADVPTPAIVIGGDCSVSVPAIGHAAGQGEGPLAVVWFDAHADLHTPATSPSGAFAGMSLRAVLGDGAAGLALPEGAVSPAHVVLAGVRMLDPEEDEQLADSEMTSLAPSDLDAPEALADAVAATGARRVYVHVDLDVLDPADIDGVSSPEPFGVTPAALVAAIGAVRARLPLAGATIAGFTPRSPEAAVDDLGTILRVVGALA
ncbi:arginase family protein [Microbacterium marinilacus]|uniref:Arginase family protein n=1 Tax=Microbacterium marinilacus TaxID=415209 RepID=A0ABP7B6G6_9MICO|nr:arginase family protein [Microbacterium marinilacus]MBY0690016.1 arginase family protein [Microbacterium marinilacus]